MDTNSFIKQYWECVARQEKEELRKYFCEDACIRWHNTNEQFNTDEFVRANCEYPGAWSVEVERIEQKGNSMITVARVWSENMSLHVTSFFTLKDDKIEMLDEYWGDDGSAPEWRIDMHLGKAISEDDKLFYKQENTNKSFSEKTGWEFIEVLSSKEPIPGGGGASAYMGAIGMALGNMVGSLTIGKKKYASVETDMIRLKEKADILQAELLCLIDKDAEAFEPLARAYRLPKETEEEKKVIAEIMEHALKGACMVPLEIMEKCCEAITLLKEFAQKGSSLAISDAGCGVACCRAALQSASLNVFINTNLMTDRIYAQEIEVKANCMLDQYIRMADDIFKQVRTKF
jgi:formiminotetrahydrofolate cyclodeaminase